MTELGELTKIGVKYHTDKAWQKKHTETYSKIFDERGIDRNSEINFLEVGISHGCSHLMWYDYFKNANIIGLDIWKIDEYYNKPGLTPNDEIKYFTDTDGEKKDKLEYIKHLLKEKDSRLHLFEGCQTDVSGFRLLRAIYNDMHVIMDDASHIDDKTKETFLHAFPLLVSGGIYIIEDLESFGSKVQRKVIKDFAYWKDNGKFNYLENFDDIESAELIHSGGGYMFGLICKK